MNTFASRETSQTQMFLCGLLVGGVAGVLLAPFSGSDARRRLKEGVQCGSEAVTKTVAESADAAKRYTADLVEQGKEIVANEKTRIKSAVDAAKTAYASSGSEAQRAAF